MNLELIDKSLHNKVAELAQHIFHPEKLVEMCNSASRDDVNGVSAKAAHPTHSLWAEGADADFTAWSVDKQLKYLLVHGFTPECIFSQAGILRTDCGSSAQE